MSIQTWFLALAVVAIAAADGSADDLTALNALKGAISNFADISQQGWVIKWEGETPCGAGGLPWTGVICTKDRVTSLLLSSFGQDVQGTLPAELDRLTALQQLSIVGQGFSGRLPASWGADGGFGELQLIDISQNQLSSTLPAEWGAPDRFQKLQALTLASNGLTGALPDTYGKAGAFPSLKSLTLSGNKISGSLPEWAEMPALETVDVSHNEALTGEVPSSWASFNLKSLCTTASRVAGGAAIPGCPASETAAVMSSASASADGSSQLDIQSGASDGASAAAASSVRLDPESFRMRTLFSTWWVWVLAVALAIAAAATLARRRNVYVLLNRRGSEPGLPRFGKGKDHKEAEPY